MKKGIGRAAKGHIFTTEVRMERDAMPNGGVLNFGSRKVQVEEDPDLDDGDYIELCISDTGIGMTSDVLDRAFEPFFTTK